MSFNVRGSFRDLGKLDACWPSRAAKNVAAIRRQAPHLVGLQECQRGNLLTYRKYLPRYEQIRGPRYGNAPPHDFNAILFDPTRVELLESGGFWLSETPERQSQSWGTRVARSANWALFGTEVGLIFYLNTHLDHKSGLARRNGGALVVGRVEELIQDLRPGIPAILTGDFNCRPGTPTYDILTQAGYADTFLAAGHRDEIGIDTFHAFQGNRYRDPHPKRGPRRIDWILLKDPSNRLDVVSHDILRDGADSPPYPSDHHPVLACFVPTGRNGEPAPTEPQA
jgi:endonuclease/exonuclease/phosphatase family metal-dependent hydrolase